MLAYVWFQNAVVSRELKPRAAHYPRIHSGLIPSLLLSSVVTEGVEFSRRAKALHPF